MMPSILDIPDIIKQFKSEKRWRNRCLLLEIIHLSMITNDNDWTIRQTARMLKLSVGQTAENLKLARAIHDIPEVNECISRNSALKMMRSK